MLGLAGFGYDSAATLDPPTEENLEFSLAMAFCHILDPDIQPQVWDLGVLKVLSLIPRALCSTWTAKGAVGDGNYLLIE